MLQSLQNDIDGAIMFHLTIECIMFCLTLWYIIHHKLNWQFVQRVHELYCDVVRNVVC